MRKLFFQLLLTVLFPYLIVFSIFSIFSNSLREIVFRGIGSPYVLLLIILVFYFAALVTTVIYLVRNLYKRQSALEMTKINMVIKLIHIPAYIFIFIVGLLCLLTIFTMLFTIAFFVFDCLAIFLTGLVGAGGIIQGAREEKITKKSAILHGILHFLFCVDVISAIIIYRRVKRVSDRLTQ